MPDDSHLEGIDPCAVWDQEAARLDDHLRALADDDPQWDLPSECEGWSVRDVVAHLLADQDYFAACLDGTVSDYIAGLSARGATSLSEFNAMGIADQAGKTPTQLLDELRERDAANLAGFRDRGDSDVDSSIGAYPARWQAFHLASEWAIHADDAHVPSDDTDRARRNAWRVPFSRFGLTESHPHLTVEVLDDGRTRVTGDGIDLALDDDTFVAAVAGRTDDPALAPLSTSP